MNVADFFNKYQGRYAKRQYKSTLKSITHWIDYYHYSYSSEELQIILLSESVKLKKFLSDNPDSADEFLPKAYAIFSETARSFFGYAPNNSQLLGAILLWKGKMVEMKSGEGKTLTAAIAAYLQGLTGRGMHIITTNDYLAERDREWMNSLFSRLGVSCGAVTQNTTPEMRKKEYTKDITYVANQEIGFDYLRDNLVVSANDKVMRGFPFAIIDEADSILIDEARTPLIISRQSDFNSPVNLPVIINIISRLELNRDYEIDPRFKTVNFTDVGIANIVGLLGRDVFKEGDLSAVQQLRYAVYVSSFLKKDKDYIIGKDKIILIDEFTGHPMWNRRLLNGLQQILEANGGVPIQGENKIAATITYRNLFKMYGKISGMSGTAVSAKEEFSELYNLEAVALEPHKSVKRIDLPVLFFRTEQEKFDFIVNSIGEVHANGDPILVVGRSISQVEFFSDLLKKRSLEHQLLHAKLSEGEFGVVSNAGKRGAITVATNMAGRGTDISLESELKEINGLIVYGLEPNLSKRIDDQLRGRSGRQGNVGRSLLFASLQDEIFQVYADDNFWDYAQNFSWAESGVADKKLERYLITAQNIAETIAADMRKKSIELDSILDNQNKFINQFREKLLTSKSVAIDAIDHIKGALNEFSAETNYYNSFWMRAEIIQTLKSDWASSYNFSQPAFNLMEEIIGALFNTSNAAENWRVGIGPHNIFKTDTGKLREQIISLIDNLWEDYLEATDDLYDRISIKSITDNPIGQFTTESSENFHDMRRRLARTMLRIVFSELNNYQVKKL